LFTSNAPKCVGDRALPVSTAGVSPDLLDGFKRQVRGPKEVEGIEKEQREGKGRVKVRRDRWSIVVLG